MAAAIYPGSRSPAGGGAGGVPGGEDGGGDGGGGHEVKVTGFLAAEGDWCGSSNPPTAKFASPEKLAAASLENRLKDLTQSSCWTSAFGGGVDLDDDIWDIRINLDGNDNLERTLSESDVTFLNLLALIDTEGYGISDNIYYVKEKGIGIAGMDLLDGHSKVQQMVELYEDKRSVSLTVIKRESTLPSNINTAAVEEQIPISEIGNYNIPAFRN